MSEGRAERPRRDERTVTAAEAVLDGTRPRNPLKRFPPFLGPAFIASVAYIDPGNFATNIQAGSAFGYTLGPQPAEARLAWRRAGARRSIVEYRRWIHYTISNGLRGAI